jgi:hypothetical protein
VVTDSAGERAILRHGNGLVRPHAHDGVDGVREGSAATVLTDRWCEMLMARTRNKEPSLASTSLAAVPETAAKDIPPVPTSAAFLEARGSHLV